MYVYLYTLASPTTKFAKPITSDAADARGVSLPRTLFRPIR